jgi:cystathionine beta-lyase
MKKDTKLTHTGRGDDWQLINPPVSRASTILFKTLHEFEEAGKGDRFSGLTYGLHGTHTAFALADALTALECSYRTALVPSGLAAITVALLACVKAGDHVLVVDCAYGPVRRFCDLHLKRLGVATTYFDPAIGAGIESLFKPATKAVLCEAPGSLTFEMQDIPAMAAVAHRHDAALLLDNTWATPYFFEAMAHGVDLSIQAGTKYIGGHADLMIGSVAATERWWLPLRDTIADFGYGVSPDDCYLTLRGLRTLGARLKVHEANALKIAAWLEGRPEVARVLFPALPSDPGYAIWKRDFSGASGLFGVDLKAGSRAALEAFVDSLRLFGIGSSWGGFESLIVPAVFKRSASKSPFAHEAIRLHIGLEDPDDLIADLEQALEKMRGANP